MTIVPHDHELIYRHTNNFLLRFDIFYTSTTIIDDGRYSTVTLSLHCSTIRQNVPPNPMLVISQTSDDQVIIVSFHRYIHHHREKSVEMT